MAPDALDALKLYHWPGNVRELRNLVERVLILNPKSQRLEKKHLPMLVYRESRESRESRAAAQQSKNEIPEDQPTLQQAREAYERDFILKTIDQHHGNITRAAEALGLERSHLYRKMKTLNVTLTE